MRFSRFFLSNLFSCQFNVWSWHSSSKHKSNSHTTYLHTKSIVTILFAYTQREHFTLQFNLNKIHIKQDQFIEDNDIRTYSRKWNWNKKCCPLFWKPFSNTRWNIFQLFSVFLVTVLLRIVSAPWWGKYLRK